MVHFNGWFPRYQRPQTAPMVQANKIRIVYNKYDMNTMISERGEFESGPVLIVESEGFFPRYGNVHHIWDAVCSPPTRNGPNCVLFLDQFMGQKIFQL